MGNFLPISTICHEFFWEVPCACMVRWHFPIPATVFWFPQSSLSQGKSIHLRFFLRQIRWDQRAEMDWKCFTWYWWISCWKLTSSWKCKEQNLKGQWEHQLRVFVGLRAATLWWFLAKRIENWFLTFILSFFCRHTLQCMWPVCWEGMDPAQDPRLVFRRRPDDAYWKMDRCSG